MLECNVSVATEESSSFLSLSFPLYPECITITMVASDRSIQQTRWFLRLVTMSLNSQSHCLPPPTFFFGGSQIKMFTLLLTVATVSAATNATCGGPYSNATDYPGNDLTGKGGVKVRIHLPPRRTHTGVSRLLQHSAPALTRDHIAPLHQPPHTKDRR